MKSAKISGFLCALLAASLLTACGKTEGDVKVDKLSMIDGTWMTDRGDILYFDSENEEFVCQTYYGRAGTGPYYAPNGTVEIYFDKTLYTLTLRDGEIVIPSLENPDDTPDENLSGMEFKKTDTHINTSEAVEYDGFWQNANGETLYIDSSEMTYTAASPTILASGTIDDKYDGKGLRLFLNGNAYICPGDEKNSFILRFEPSETQSPDGTFEGVFYRNGDSNAYSEPDSAFFFDDEYSDVWYSDGLNHFCLGSGYTIGDDGLAYSESGRLFGAGFDYEPYDPATDWGDDWYKQD